MNQADVSRLVSKLRYNVNRRRNLKNPLGPQGRHDKIRKVVTALIKHERIELNYNKADESRGYAERLISDAIRFGDCHKETMKMASYWLLEKQLVHKLFKVLAPRYQNSTLSYTKMWRAPHVYPGHHYDKVVLELRNNVYPPLGPDTTYNKNLLHNVLLREAKKAWKKKKGEEMESEANEAEATRKVKVEGKVDEDHILETIVEFDKMMINVRMPGTGGEGEAAMIGTKAGDAEGLRETNAEMKKSEEEKTGDTGSRVEIDTEEDKHKEKIDKESEGRTN